MQGPKLPFCPWNIYEFLQPLQIPLKRCHRRVGVGFIRGPGLNGLFEAPDRQIQQPDCLTLLATYPLAHLAPLWSGVVVAASRRPPALPRSASAIHIRADSR